VDAAVRLAPGNARYWIEVANSKKPDDSSADDALDRARKLNPHDPAVWIQSGLRAESRGERARAEAFLLRAELLSRQCEPQTMLANFYFRAGDQPHFWPRVKRALACATEDRKPLFDLCWNMTPNGSFILREAMPGAAAAGRDFLQYLLSHNRLDAAEAVSLTVAARAGAADRELLLRYTDRMVDAGRWDAALVSWNALCERKILPYEPLDRERGPWLTNGTFGAPPLNAGFDWHIPKIGGVSVSRCKSPNALRIDFSGEQPEECEVLRQYVPVRPLRSYALKGVYRLSGIASGAGLHLRLTDADKGIEIAAAELNGGSVQLSFNVPERTSALLLSLWYRRMPGTTRVEGSIMLSSVYLEAHR